MNLKIALFLLAIGASARAGVPVLELIDVPTADVADHYGAHLGFRFYREGGVLTKAAFGVLPRLNVGFGLDTERFIGDRSADVNRPTLNMKFRAFDGGRNLPAVALGFDGQGYFFNEATDKYDQREKGLFLVGSGEIVVPGLGLAAGVNMYDFKEDDVYGFAGLSYFWADVFGVLFEADNLFHRPRDSRFNAGARYHITPNFSLDLAGRDLWSARRSERILRITYSATF